jgi:hypothetical protein
MHGLKSFQEELENATTIEVDGIPLLDADGTEGG